MKYGFGTMKGKIDNNNEFFIQDKLVYAAGVDYGMNYFDTGYFYQNGRNEDAVINIIDELKLEGAEITIKLPLELCNSKIDALTIMNEQLQKIERIRYLNPIVNYFFHTVTVNKWKTIKEYNLLEIVSNLKKENKIQGIGFSFHDNYSLFEEMLNSFDWDLCAINLNFLDKDEQAGINGIILAAEKGVRVIGMRILKGGSLKHFTPEVENLMKYFHHDWSIPEWSYRWALNIPGVDTILISAYDLEQMSEIFSYNDGYVFTEDDWSMYNIIVSEFYKNADIKCEKCEKCIQLCPQQVNIPKILLAYNNYNLLNHYTKHHDLEYITNEEHYRNCIKCGLCEAICEKNIKILDVFEQIRKLRGD